MELNDSGAEREEVERCSSAGGQQERSKEESSSLSPPSQTPQTPQSPPSGALLFTNMQLPASLTQPLTSPKPADTGSELPSPSVADPVKPAANSCLVLSPPTASSNTQPSSETASTSLPPTPASQGEQQQQQVCYTSQPILPQASPAAPVTLIPPPRPPGTLAPGSLTTLVLPTSTPRPLLVLPSPAPTLLVSSPRLMRLPLLLPTQTLQLLPPASMDTQGKKSVLLTTIKVAAHCHVNLIVNNYKTVLCAGPHWQSNPSNAARCSEGTPAIPIKPKSSNATACRFKQQGGTSSSSVAKQQPEQPRWPTNRGDQVLQPRSRWAADQGGSLVGRHLWPEESPFTTGACQETRLGR